MPRGKGYGRSHGKHSRQMGTMKGGGRRRSGGPINDPKGAKAMQMRDASNGKQRHFTRSSDNPKTPKR